MIVADASVLVHFVLNSTGSSEINRLIANEDVLAAPVVVDLEVINTLRRHYLARQVTRQRADQAKGLFASLAINRYAIIPFLDRIWELKNNLTAYDASYVALAESLRLPIFTRDKRLANAAGHGATIRLI